MVADTTARKSNPFKALARSRKVAALLAVVPHGRTPDEIRKIADWLKGTDSVVRTGIAMQACVKAPSPETWDLLVAAARARTPLDELQAEADRLLGVSP